MTQKHIVSHDTLGHLTGRLVHSKNVIQFRSIPFAKIPARFRQSILVHDLGNERDFTEYGYACPSRHQGNDFSGGPMPGYTDMKYDEFKCLSLTITTPLKCMSEGGSVYRETEKLPVLVYVHGGGFIEGGGSVNDSHDTSHMAGIGLLTGRPVVTINIAYRLNYQGLLACQDLVDEAKVTKEPPSNFSLYDQRNAFLWIKNYVSGFGGDPENITAFGESAGSGSICFHLCAPLPLFRRAILMSGSPTTLPPTTLETKEKEYMELLDHCGIKKDSEGRLDALRNVPIEKLVELASPKGMMNTTHDSNFFPEMLNGKNVSDLVAKCEWVDEIIIGDSFLEGFFFADAYKNVKVEDYISCFEDNLGPEGAFKILKSYGISAGMDSNLFWTRAMMLGGDLLLSEPMHELAEYLSEAPSSSKNGKKKKIFRYTNTMRNPFPGSNNYQVCGHAIEMLYVFGNLLDRFPTDHGRELSLGFVDRFIKFAYGEEPWGQYVVENRERNIAVADGRMGWVERTREEDERISRDDELGKRRYAQWDVIGEIFRELNVDDSERARKNLVLVLRK